jgi:glycosyltransferase involved in cell wall biosynthesis
MTAHRPRVSIGLPVYNGESFLRQALDSILVQTFGDFELIVSDNASCDDTREICLDYARRDGRIRYFRNPVNRGASSNFNRVFRLSSGEYFKWAAADDVLEPECLARCVQLLDEDPMVILAYPRVKVIMETEQRFSNFSYRCVDLQSPVAWDRIRQLLVHGFWTPYYIFGLIRSSILRQTRLMRHCVMADDCLLVDLALLGRFGHVPEELIRFRLHPDSFTGNSWASRPGHAEAKWFDTGNKGRLLLPEWRRLWEFLLSILGSEEKLIDKMGMALDLCRVAYWRRHELVEEVRTAATPSIPHASAPIAGNRR